MGPRSLQIVEISTALVTWCDLLGRVASKFRRETYHQGSFREVLLFALAISFSLWLMAPTERELSLARPAARPSFRRLAAESLHRGDHALARLDLPAAVHHYATAGVTYRHVGAAVPAAIAFLELGGLHLALDCPDQLAAIATTLRQLRADETPPPGRILFVQVCAQILEQATEKPLPFVELLERLRRQRRDETPEDLESTLWPAMAGHPMTPKENPEMAKAPLFTLPADELHRVLAGHPGWEIIENGARLERVIPLADLRMTAREPGREMRPLQRSAAELAQRIVRMGVAVSCAFDGERVEIRVPATRLGLGFVEECDHASVTGPPPEGAGA